MTSSLLAILVLPILGALFFAFYPVKPKSLSALAAIFSYCYSALTSLTAILALASDSGFSIQSRAFHLGVSGFEMIPRFFLDGCNASFVLLLGLCPPVVFTLLRDRECRYGKSYYACAFALVAALAGVFTSDSLLLFYFFWEAALIAVYFWIGLYGKPGFHAPRVYPVLLRFVLFTLAGSLPMLVSIAAVCAADLRDPGLHGLAAVVSRMAPNVRLWVFGGFLLGFSVKLPLLGFHGWLRDTYNVAPPACRALLSAAMSKMGAFGLIMILAPSFSGEILRFAPQLQILAVMGVVYGAMLTLAQERLIDLLAYGSLSHLSLLALGVFTAVGAGDAATTGLSGSVLLVFNHGLIMVLLFSLDARVLPGEESPDKGLLTGLRGRQRRLTAFLLLAIFASASLPGLSNFVGEILIYFAAFQASPWLVFFAASGALIGAGALVRFFHSVFLGSSSSAGRSEAILSRDLDAGETAIALVLAAIWLALGLYPMLLLHPVERAILFLDPVGWTG